MGKQKDKGGNGVNVQEKREGSDQPISENTKGAGIPKGGDPKIPKGVIQRYPRGIIQGHLRYVN